MGASPQSLKKGKGPRCMCGGVGGRGSVFVFAEPESRLLNLSGLKTTIPGESGMLTRLPE